MYCPECSCGFSRWSGRCSVCGTALVEHAPPELAVVPAPVPYDELVAMTTAAGGRLTVPLSATDVAVERKWRFPYSGFGYAWVKRLQGVEGVVSVDLRTTDVGRKRAHRFPYFAFGYAWAREMQGTVGDTEITVTAREVESRRSRRFPWLGRGYAWTSEWFGTCGADLQVSVSTTDVALKRASGFPYRGYGLAWARSAVLTLSAADGPLHSRAADPGTCGAG